MEWLLTRIKSVPLVDKYVKMLFSTETRRRLMAGAMWTSVASVITRVVGLAGSFILARTLGKEVFGEYGMINSTATTIGGMAGLGIGNTIIKYVSELKGKDKTRIGRIVALSTTVLSISASLYVVIFIAFAPWLAVKLLAAPHLAPMLRINALAVGLGIVNAVQYSSLIGCEAFKVLTCINIFQSLTQTVLVLLGARMGGLKGAVWMFGLSTVLVVVWTRWNVSKEWKKMGITLEWWSMFKEWRILLGFSLPAFLAGMSVGPISWGCTALLANQPNGYEQLGIFNAANQWQAAIQFLPAMIGSAVLPVLSEKYGSGDSHHAIRIMRGMMKVIACLVVPATIVISACSTWIMKGYGESFVSGRLALCLSVATAALLAVMTPVGQCLSASGRMWTGFWMNAGWGGVMVGSSLLMVRWGAEGLAGARLIAYLTHSIWVFLYVAWQKGEKAEKYQH